MSFVAAIRTQSGSDGYEHSSRARDPVATAPGSDAEVVAAECRLKQ
jgi:hypothetical protein